MNTIMPGSWDMSRRTFLARVGLTAGGMGLLSAGAVRLLAGTPQSKYPDMLALRRDVIHSPIRIGLHRAKVFTEVFQKNESKPWVLRKALALREYLESVPLYL